MKYNISINQVAISENFPTLGLKHAVIIDYIKDFAHTGKMEVKVYAKKIYYWVEYETLLNEMPLLNIKKDTLYRYFKEMCEAKIFIAHPENSIAGKSFYAFGEAYSLIISQQPTEKNPHPYGKKSAPPTEKNPHPLRKKILTDNNTKDNNTNDNINTHTEKNSENLENFKNSIDYTERRRYTDDHDALKTDLLNLYKTDESFRTRISQKFEEIGVKDSEAKKTKIRQFAQKFADQFLKNKRREFEKNNNGAKIFEAYASLMELHSNFINSFNWLKRINFDKLKQKTDRAGQTTSAPVLITEPKAHTEGVKENDDIKKLQIEQCRKWILAGRLSTIDVEGVNEIDLRLNYKTGVYESVNLTRVKAPLSGFKVVRVQGENT